MQRQPKTIVEYNHRTMTEWSLLWWSGNLRNQTLSMTHWKLLISDTRPRHTSTALASHLCFAAHKLGSTEQDTLFIVLPLAIFSAACFIIWFESTDNLCCYGRHWTVSLGMWGSWLLHGQWTTHDLCLYSSWLHIRGR